MYDGSIDGVKVGFTLVTIEGEAMGKMVGFVLGQCDDSNDGVVDGE
jgi:hypothetical protein